MTRRLAAIDAVSANAKRPPWQYSSYRVHLGVEVKQISRQAARPRESRRSPCSAGAPKAPAYRMVRGGDAHPGIRFFIVASISAPDRRLAAGSPVSRCGRGSPLICHQFDRRRSFPRNRELLFLVSVSSQKPDDRIQNRSRKRSIFGSRRPKS